MEELKYKTLPDLLLAQVKKSGDREFIRFRRDGRWVSLSWNETFQLVQNFGIGLYKLGIRKEDKVAILSEDGPWWFICDFGIKSIGAITVSIHITSSAEQVGYYISHSDARIVIVSNKASLQKVLENEDIVSRLVAIVVIDTQGVETSEKIFGFKEMGEKGKNNPDVSIKANQFKAAKGSDVTSIIFTSGTTGEPRGVMLTHENFFTNMISLHERNPFDKNTVYLSILPMSHVYSLSVGIYKAVYVGAILVFSSGVENLPQEIKEIRPDVMIVVPRVLEKIYNGIWDAGLSGNFLKRAIFLWAVSVAKDGSQRILQGDKVTKWLWLKRFIADVLVFRKIKNRLGGRLHYFVCGGAPLHFKIVQFFHSMGILIIEGYGLTEASPVITTNGRYEFKLGTVGKPLRDMEVLIAEDGEILAKGPSVMKGYYKDEEATRAAIDSSGWLHTGDIGELDDDGYLIIKDRKKDIIVLSTGKNVTPQIVENLLKEDPYIEQVIIFGEGKSYIVALILPDIGRLLNYAKEKGLDTSDLEKVLNSDVIHGLISERIEQVNSRLAKHEKVRSFALVSKALTEEDGELTPTLKVKRRVIEEKYGHLIKAMYKD